MALVIHLNLCNYKQEWENGRKEVGVDRLLTLLIFSPQASSLWGSVISLAINPFRLLLLQSVDIAENLHCHDLQEVLNMGDGDSGRA